MEESYLFDKRLGTSIRNYDYKRITRTVRKQYDKYQANENVFIRCAILKLLKEDEASR